jgi:imidazolonepropionase-like amidohydrolase/glyoxylase-like metal-dependent hydrolase (beta-lactamase superfamily II)
MSLSKFRHLGFATLACFYLAGLPGTAQQYGATVAKPYTQADIDYGRKLQAKIDKARADSTGAIAKMPIEPFHVVGDVYDIGVHNWGVYLVVTPKGIIMLDTGWQDTTELLQRNIEKLGFALSDIKIILMTEFHGDHNGGVAYFKRATGAQVMVMDDDVADVEKGTQYPGAKVDRILHDHDTVTLGGKTLTAYHIPGHTPGSTTWYWQETEGGTTYNVGDICCWFTPANVVSDPQYPTKLLEKDWATLKSLPVDIPLPGIHHYHFDYLGKMARLKAGEKNVWVDPEGYRGIIASFEQDFKDKVVEQTKNGPPPARAGGGPPPGGPPPAKPFAVTNVRIFDGETTIEKGTVYVADGKIAAAGTNVNVPAGTATIDGTGKTIMPGLIDSHVHMAESYFTAGGMVLEQAMTYGVTTVMDMGVSDSQSYQIFKRKIKANEFTTGADLFTAGVGATVAGGHGAIRDTTALFFTSPDQAQPWVDGRGAAGSDYIKIFSETFAEHGRNVPTLTDAEIAAIVAAAHKDKLMAVAHTLQESRARQAVLAGVDGLVHISPYDPPSPDFGKFMAAHHTFESTNLISYAPVSYKQELATDPDLSPYMPKDMIAGLANARLFADSHHEYSMAALKEIHEAGVPVLAGTDIGYPYAPLLHAELEIMVKDGGFTPTQALQAATGNPAKVYPMLADRGRIAPGMRADLLLLDGDPTQNILATRKIVKLWRMGREIDRNELKVEVTAPELPKGGPGGPPPGAGPGGGPRPGGAPAGAARPSGGPPAAQEHDDEP